MSVLDIFKQDAFGVLRITDALRELKYVPSRIGQLGLFTTDNVDTLTVAIEKDADQVISIVGTSPRGGPGETRDKKKRSIRNLTIPHYQVDDAIYADEIQSVRRFGDEVATERMQEKIARRGGEISQSFALTEEYNRLSVITTGNLLDKDGAVIFNYFTEMGEAQPAEIDFDLDNATPAAGALRKRCAGVTRAFSTTLDGLPFAGVHAFCGDAFFDDLIAHVEVRDTYLGHTSASELRTAYVGAGQGGSYGMFEFGGIVWENYRGGQNVGIATDKCHFVPMGVPGLFRSIYGPADYLETVNTPGQRLYGKQWEMPNGKGVNLEFQSNALHYCTRPRTLLRGRRT